MLQHVITVVMQFIQQISQIIQLNKMKNKLISIDKFYEHKNIEFLKLIRYADNRGKYLGTRKRLINFMNKVATEMPQQDTSKQNNQHHKLSTSMDFVKTVRDAPRKVSLVFMNKSIEKQTIVIHSPIQNEQNIFHNEFLRQKLRLACNGKQKQIVSQKIQDHKAKGKFFKIRPNKLRMSIKTEMSIKHSQ